MAEKNPREKQPRDESRASTVREGGSEAWTAAGEYIERDEQLPVSAGSKTPSDRMFAGDESSAATTEAGGTSQSGTSPSSLREPSAPIERRTDDRLDVPSASAPPTPISGAAGPDAGMAGTGAGASSRLTTAGAQPGSTSSGATLAAGSSPSSGPGMSGASGGLPSMSSSPTGSSFTSSAAPLGEGSNTPVGNEPSDFRSWDARQPDPSQAGGDNWGVQGMNGLSSTKLGGMLAAGVAGTLVYAWWQRRHRKTRAERVRDLLVDAGQKYGAGVPRALGETMGTSKSPWLPFVLLPLAWYLRSQGGKAAKAGDQLLKPLKLDDRGQILARQGAGQLETYGRRLIGEVEKRDPTIDRGWGWTPWLLAMPIAGGAAYLGREYLGQGASAVKDYAEGYGMTGGTIETGGKLVSDVMSRSPETILPDAKLVDAARRMRDLDIGSLPVYDGQRLIGVVTDRDISVRATAEGKDPSETPVRQVMSSEVAWVFDDEPAAMAASVMRRRQIRRLPVLDRDDKLVGMVALGDLATDLPSDAMKGATLEDISKPSRSK